MPDYQLANLQSDQPCLWLPLVLPACQIACRAKPGEVTTFEVLRFDGESDDHATETWSIVHPKEASNTTAAGPEALGEEQLQLAAAVVMAGFLRASTNQRITRISRSDVGLSFYLDEPDEDEGALLIVIGSAERDVIEALNRATDQAQYAPCARRFAAAVAFGSGKAALRVLT